MLGECVGICFSGNINREAWLYLLQAIAYFLLGVYLIRPKLSPLLLVGIIGLLIVHIYQYSVFEADFYYRYKEKEMYLLYAVGFGGISIIAFMVFLKRKIHFKWNLSWLHIFTSAFIVGAIVHRIYFMGRYMKIYLYERARIPDGKGYVMDFLNLWQEILMVLLLVVLIRALRGGVYIKNLEVRKMLLPLFSVSFAVLTSWFIMRMVMIIQYGIVKHFVLELFIRYAVSAIICGLVTWLTYRRWKNKNRAGRNV